MLSKQKSTSELPPSSSPQTVLQPSESQPILQHQTWEKEVNDLLTKIKNSNDTSKLDLYGQAIKAILESDPQIKNIFSKRCLTDIIENLLKLQKRLTGEDFVKCCQLITPVLVKMPFQTLQLPTYVFSDKYEWLQKKLNFYADITKKYNSLPEASQLILLENNKLLLENCISSINDIQPQIGKFSVKDKGVELENDVIRKELNIAKKDCEFHLYTCTYILFMSHYNLLIERYNTSLDSLTNSFNDVFLHGDNFLFISKRFGENKYSINEELFNANMMLAKNYYLIMKKKFNENDLSKTNRYYIKLQAIINKLNKFDKNLQTSEFFELEINFQNFIEKHLLIKRELSVKSKDHFEEIGKLSIKP